jgi:hypothetical protein
LHLIKIFKHHGSNCFEWVLFGFHGTLPADGYIQRSAFLPAFRDAAKFYRWFCAQKPELVAMIKLYKGGRDNARPDPPNEYGPIPLNSVNDYCRVDVLGIHSGANVNRSDVVAAIEGTPLASTRIV